MVFAKEEPLFRKLFHKESKGKPSSQVCDKSLPSAMGQGLNTLTTSLRLVTSGF